MKILTNKEGIDAVLFNTKTNEESKVKCKYIIGADGSHSAVRKLLGIQFEGT